MPAKATELVEGSFIRQNKDGYWARRRITLEGLPATGPGLVLGESFPADGGGTIDIPEWSNNHPLLIGTLCFQVEQRPYPEKSRTGLIVEADYGPIDLINGWKITVYGSNGMKTASIDASGSPLFPIFYTDTDGNQQKDFGVATYLSPGCIVVFEHDEFESPWSKATALRASTNSQPFLGFDPHDVLCRDVQIESFVSATRWHVRYIFDCDPSPLGWKQAMVFHDKYTGQIPDDVSGTDGSNGILFSDPYQDVIGGFMDFNAFGLPTALLTG